MRGYSLDLRERVIKGWQDSKGQNWLAETFGISLSTVKRYIARYKALGHVQATRQRRKQPTISEEQLPLLVEQLRANRGATLEDHIALWKKQQGSQVSVSMMWRAIDRAGWTYKKRQWQPKNAMQ
jgi:transposase